MMFRLSIAQPRDRAVLARFVLGMLRRGPAGLMRLARNAVRFLRGRGEHPASIDWWRGALSDAGLADVGVRALEHEGAIATACRQGATRPQAITGGRRRALARA
jgi:hypothetical protein